MNLLFQSDKD